MSEDGVIVTNAHVVNVDKNSKLTVKLTGGRSFEGRILKIDKSADLAIIKIECVIKKNLLFNGLFIFFMILGG